METAATPLTALLGGGPCASRSSSDAAAPQSDLLRGPPGSLPLRMQAGPPADPLNLRDATSRKRFTSVLGPAGAGAGSDYHSGQVPLLPEASTRVGPRSPGIGRGLAVDRAKPT